MKTMAKKRTQKHYCYRAAVLGFAVALSAVCPADAQLLPSGGGMPPFLGGQILQSLPSALGRTIRPIGNTLVHTVDSAKNILRDTVGRPLQTSAFARDNHGARIVPEEILAISASSQSLATARDLGLTIVSQNNLASLGLSVTVLRVPDGTDLKDALAALRRTDPAGQFDYNHIYNPSGGNVSLLGNAAAGESMKGVAAIGMIDAGIDLKHPVFAQTKIKTETFAGLKSGPPTAHGTAVASLLAGQDDRFHGALDGAVLYAADVYGGDRAGGNADDIARALAWLAANNVPVVNMSLVGPPNALLKAATAAFVKRGHILVAAVGNGGPAAPENYPAAYPGVVGVTSVDADRQIQLDANQGADVAFAADGVDVQAAALGGGYAPVTGTSFAAPLVAARFAAILHSPDSIAAQQAWMTLEKAAIDLGAPGRDPVFGYGYLARPADPMVHAPRADFQH